MGGWGTDLSQPSHIASSTLLLVVWHKRPPTKGREPILGAFWCVGTGHGDPFIPHKAEISPHWLEGVSEAQRGGVACSKAPSWVELSISHGQSPLLTTCIGGNNG